MSSENVKIIHMNEAVADVNERQITVEPSNDADLGFPMWAGKDAAGNTTKWLAKDKAARVASIAAQNMAGGPVESDSAGNMTAGWVLEVPAGTTRETQLTTSTAAQETTDPNGDAFVQHMIVQNGPDPDVDFLTVSTFSADRKIFNGVAAEINGMDEPTAAGRFGYNSTDQLPSAHNGTREVVLGKFSSCVDLDVADAITSDTLVYDADAGLWKSSANGMPASGFRDPILAVTASHVSSVLTVTFTGNVELYYQGLLLAEGTAGSWVAPTLTTTGITSPRYLKINLYGTIEWDSSYPNYNEVLLAVALFTSGGSYVATLTAHCGIGMSAFQREADRYRRGVWSLSDFALSSYTTGSTTATDRRPDVAGGYIAMLDRYYSLAGLTGSSAAYVRAKMNGVFGSGGGMILTGGSTEFVETSGGIPVYNSQGYLSYAVAPIPAGQYGYYYLVAVPAASDAASTPYRFLWLMGQHYGTIEKIRNIHPSDLELMDLASVWRQFVFLQKVIISVNAGGTDWTIYDVQAQSGDQAFQTDRAGTRGVLDVVADEVNIGRTDGNPAEINRGALTISKLLPAVVALTDDTSAALTASTVREVLLTGAASNAPVSLPDATTLRGVGDTFRVTNAMTEVAIVQNYGTASSAFELLLPGDTLTCMCTSVATATGTWAVTRDMNPNVLDSDPDFFSCGTIADSPQWNFGNLTMGVGSAHTMATDSLATGVVGDAYLSIGTGASGGFVARGNKGYASAATNCLAPLNRGKAFMLRQNWSVSAVPDGTDTYTARFGLHDSDAVASAPANGAYFKLGAAGQVTPECITATTPTTGTAGTAIATPSSTPKRTDLVIVGKSDGTRVDFWRDATHAGSITTVPKTAKMYAGFHIARTGGSTQRIFSISRMQFRAVR